MTPTEPFRKIEARWVFTARLTLQTAAQIGSHPADDCDQTFGRDSQGRPILQGTTLGGALRSALNDRLAGYRRREEDDKYRRTEKLFGSLSSSESPVIVFDSVMQEDMQATSIRDGVRIAPATGLAEAGKKYDRELSLPGLTFPIRLDLIVADQAQESELLGLLVSALEGLTNDSIRFGARKNRGLGQCAATQFRARRFNLKTVTGWRDYAKLPHSIDPLTPQDDVQLNNLPLPDGAQPTFSNDERRKMRLTFHLRVEGTLLIRSPGLGAKSADAVQLTETDCHGNNAAQVVSGTSVAGAFRAQAGRILNTVGQGGTNLLDELFGTSPEAGERGAVLFGSRIIFSEARLEGNRTYRQTRVKIDRFTGGALDTALFDEEPAVGGEVTFDVFVLAPSPAQTALTLMTARDLLDGFFVIGGGANVGRGRLCGNITGNLADGTAFTLDAEGLSGVSSEDQQMYLDALHAKEQTT